MTKNKEFKKLSLSKREFNEFLLFQTAVNETYQLGFENGFKEGIKVNPLVNEKLYKSVGIKK